MGSSTLISEVELENTESSNDKWTKIIIIIDSLEVSEETSELLPREAVIPNALISHIDDLLAAKSCGISKVESLQFIDEVNDISECFILDGV